MYSMVLKEYYQWINNHSALTISTKKSYFKQIQNFLSYLEQHEISSLNNIPSNKLRSFIYYRQTKPYSNSWSRVKTASLDLFFRWAFDFRYCSEQHIVQLRKSKIMHKPLANSSDVIQQPFIILSEQEQAILLNSIVPYDTTNLIEVRNQCIITLLLASGLFAEELVTLLFEDLNLKKGYVFTQANPLRTRKISLDLAVCQSACEEWISLREKLFTKTDPQFLFFNKSLRPISKRMLHKIVFKALENAHIQTKRGGPEILRQTALCNRIRIHHSFEKLRAEFGIKTLGHIEAYRKQIANEGITKT